MKFHTLITLLLLTAQSTFAQHISASDLLDKSIAFHDPQGNWQHFNGTLNITMETPKGSPRESKIHIDLPNELFQLIAKRDSVQTTYTLDKKKCTTTLKDSIAGKRTPCETATLYKDYYTYLYGLPMKLKDPGTTLDPKVEKLTFKGKEYLKLQVHYDAEVGTDVWQFYFDPETYAMEVYQFFKGDPKDAGKNTGEYILLKNLKTINGINFPQERAWYYNKDNAYLGTDFLK